MLQTVFPADARAQGAEQSISPARFLLQQIVLEKSSVLAAADVETVAARWRGKWVGGYELFVIQRELSELYERRGFRGSGALLGDQSVEAGVVHFHAREVRIEDVRIEPRTRWIWPFLVRDLVWPERNALLNVDVLQERLSALRDSPHLKRIDADLSIGTDNPSSAILSLAIDEPPPLSAWILAANNRNPGIGDVRREVGMSHRSLLGLGDQLEFRRGRTEGLGDSAWNYALPIPKLPLTFTIARSRGDSRAIEPRVFRDLDIAAISNTRSLGLTAALWQSGAHSFTIGALRERRDSATSLLGIPFSFTLGIADGESRVDVDRASLEYIYRAAERHAALRLVASKGRVSPLADAGIAGAVEPAFRHVQAGFSASQGFLQNQWEARLRVDAQFTRHTLAPVERLSFGGVNGVRGYRENLFLRDRGVIARLEMGSAAWEPAAWLKVSPSVFVDGGWGRDVVRRNDGFPARISSGGIALDVRMAKYFRVNAAFARARNRDFSSGGNAQDRGIHVMAGVYYP